jgi:hypothetical protein
MKVDSLETMLLLKWNEARACAHEGILRREILPLPNGERKRAAPQAFSQCALENEETLRLIRAGIGNERPCSE